ncbi:MAG: hypothetical protein DBY24_10270 [Prevotellaceae bacterium]|nr:MAG: hypothetical protein DBY24_10270 [Prevotellaceae bacterium]
MSGSADFVLPNPMFFGNVLSGIWLPGRYGKSSGMYVQKYIYVLLRNAWHFGRILSRKKGGICLAFFTLPHVIKNTSHIF